MTCDHRMGWPPAANEDYNGLFHVEQPEAASMPADACGQRVFRRYVDPTCMTKSDHEGRERDVQAGRFGLPLFAPTPVEVIAWQHELLRAKHEEASAHARQMGKEHQERMREAQSGDIAAVLQGMQRAMADWNDG